MLAPTPRHPYHPPPPAPPADLRPFARRTRLQRRLGYRLATGLTPAQAAAAEDTSEAEVRDLLADPGFAALIDEFRALESLPEDETRRRLTSHARFLLREAVAEGDVRAAAFILREESRGRDPARTLADGVLASHRRAATPPPHSARSAAPTPSPSPLTPRTPAHLVDRDAWRSAARLRAALLREHAAGHAALQAEPPADAPPAPPPSPERRPNRRQRRRLAALRRRTESASVPAITPPRDIRPAPRSRSP